MGRKKLSLGRKTWTRQPPEGDGSTKRTPLSAFDKARGQSHYTVEAILGEATQQIHNKPTTVWLVKWVGLPMSSNTYEPIENLAGEEGRIKAYRQAKAVQDKAVADELAKKKAQKDAREQARVDKGKRSQASQGREALQPSALPSDEDDDEGAFVFIMYTF